MHRAIVLIVLGFAITLAAVVGMRMSAEAMAVVVGVVCGVAAAIPMSLLLLAAAQRRRVGLDEPTYGPSSGRQPAYPPVVVIQGGQPLPSWSSSSFPGPQQAASSDTLWSASPRQFRVVGEDTDAEA